MRRQRNRRRRSNRSARPSHFLRREDIGVLNRRRAGARLRMEGGRVVAVAANWALPSVANVTVAAVVAVVHPPVAATA